MLSIVSHRNLDAKIHDKDKLVYWRNLESKYLWKEICIADIDKFLRKIFIDEKEREWLD